jgi:2-dehydropantoate 2-reductase
MRIAIIGTGGIGGPLGGSLLKAGIDVTLVARGAHLAAIREKGLHIEGDRGEILVQPVRVTDDVDDIGPVDFVVLCVKSWDVELAGKQIRPIVGSQTAVIPLQNGIDAAQRLVSILGSEAVMGGVAFVTGAIIAPGIIHQTGTHQRIIFGELDGRISERGQQLHSLCESAGFEGVLSPSIIVPIWEKFVGLVPFSGLSALTRLPLVKWRDDADLLTIYEAALRETVGVGLAEGVDLPPAIIDNTLAQLRTLPPHMMASMGQDLIRGNRLELPWLGGKVIALGRHHGIPTPVNRFIYAALKLYLNGTPP